MKNKKIVYQIILLLLTVTIIGFNCKKPFEPPAIKANKNFLIVDGYIEGGTKRVSTFKLSRSWNVGDTITSLPELSAQVIIEEEGGPQFFLQHKGGGVYMSDSLTLNPSRNCRLLINTAGSGRYRSEYVPLKESPAIDSISWQQNEDVTVYVHTQDPSNKTIYYRWDYDETWEYRALYETGLGQKNGRIFYRDSANQVYRCWSNAPSNNIVIGTSAKLASDIIAQQPVTLIRNGSDKISVRYSILVRQYAITREAFEYWQILQKNSQSTGTLFDPQPSQIRGNIRNIDDPAEVVIGFVSASTVTSKRQFIRHNQLTNWKVYVPGEFCGETKIPQDPTDYLNFYYSDTTFSPYYFTSGGELGIIKNSCVDCTRRGGVNTAPSFW